MRKRTLLLILSIVVTAFLLLIPFFISQKHIQEQITSHVKETYGLLGNASTMKWRWFPIPALEIHALAMESNSFSLRTEKLLFYPNWLSPFIKDTSLGRITLFEPDLLIKKNPARDSVLTSLNYPKVTVNMIDGHLRILSDFFEKGLHLRQLDFDDINGKISFNYHRVKFNLGASPNFSHSIKITGRVDLAKKYYRLDIKTKGLDLAEIIPPKQNMFWKPVSTDFSLRFNIEGLGFENGRVTISEQAEPFSIKLSGIPFHVEKFEMLKFTWHDQDLFFGIGNLQLTDPTLQLNGQVSLRHRDNEQEPIWHFDLEANEIGITNLRQRLLSLWGNDPHLQEVCTIVRGGRAKTARFIFEGPSSDLQHLKRLKIWAVADEVELYIPDIDLAIDRASGPISILDGHLSGKELTASIGTSHGKNGTIFLALTHDEHDFTLDADLDLDLLELQDSLESIIHSDAFTHELEMFSTVQGRVSGNLAIGNDLRDLKTNISVLELKAAGTYDRLPWPFSIHRARLKLFPGHFQWESVGGTLGRHSISQSSGQVTWNGKTMLDLTALDANLDLAQLFEQGRLATEKTTFSLKNYFAERIDSLSGTVSVSQTHLSGPAANPDKWRFATDITSSDLSITGPFLPPNLSGSAINIALSSQKATFNGLFKVFDQQLYMTGDYHHRYFKNWDGELGINGMISAAIGQWIKQQALIPVLYFPRLPFQLEQFRLNTHAAATDAFQFQGRIIAAPSTAAQTILDFDINRQEALELNSLIFNKQGKQGKLTYNRWYSKDNKTLLTWQGELEATTLETLFSENIFTAGQIKGVFSRLTNEAKPARTTYAGYLDANNLTWQPANNPSIFTIDNLHLSGNNDLLKIDALDLRLNEQQTHIEGEVQTQGKHHTVDLTLTSPKLSWSNLQSALSTYASYSNDPYDIQSDINIAKSKALLPSNVSGSVNFSIDSFSYTAEKKQETSEPLAADKNDAPPPEPHTFVWIPIQGTATSIDTRNIDLDITASTLCNMEMTGSWKLGAQSHQSVFNLPQNSTPLLFEDVLPCLGVKAELISGPFYLQGSIQGIPDNWSTGDLILSSPKGLIKKMNLLSKVFSVVNFTELFTWEAQPGLNQPGLRYNDMILKSHVTDNKLLIDKAVLKGKGVNLTGRGEINLVNLETALTFFIAPFKMLDSVITNVPLVGKALGGKKKSILTFPVGVKGPLQDPEVTALPASAIGSAALEFVMDALTLPFRMFIPADDKDDLPALPPTESESPLPAEESLSQ